MSGLVSPMPWSQISYHSNLCPQFPPPGMRTCYHFHLNTCLPHWSILQLPLFINWFVCNTRGWFLMLCYLATLVDFPSSFLWFSFCLPPEHTLWTTCLNFELCLSACKSVYLHIKYFIYSPCDLRAVFCILVLPPNPQL
ncbi:hypothetical protein GOODEAATRI_013082 [Goodea atripinnis]|uniref:Uncharacterized protein n=1 Tax=Goodea atripinnis TaxID=208336 RepID=A0ABV0NA92_9TELE